MTLGETKVDTAASMRDFPNYFGPCLDAVWSSLSQSSATNPVNGIFLALQKEN